MFPVTLTPLACEQIRALGGCLRLAVEPGGCCGRTYVFSLHGQPADLRFSGAGVTLFVGAEALAVLAGATLDYGARLKPPRFRVLHNPNTPQRCPCNRSFGEAFAGRLPPHCRAACPMSWLQEAEAQPPTPAAER